MNNIKDLNLDKNTISNKIFREIGVSKLYSKKIVDDIIDSLIILLKKKKLNIKNFGTFRIIEKKERIGRNPKNGKIYLIKARKSISFILSRKINDLINKDG